MADSIPQLFDRRTLRRRRDRASATFPTVDFLKREACARLGERLEEVTREFPLCIELGAHTGLLRSEKIKRLITTDGASAMHPDIVCDEERMPFAESCADAVVSALSLQWVNDLPGTLIQIKHALKPDGLFLAVLPGAHTLRELREVLEQAEMELRSGVSPHISPFVDVRDAGNLLLRAGFALPMADSETLTVSYPHMFALLDDLRRMGEANALMQRPGFLRRDVLMRAAELYVRRYCDDEGRVSATFELVFLTGWKPHASQPQPARRGSGKHSLAEALNAGDA